MAGRERRILKSARLIQHEACEALKAKQDARRAKIEERISITLDTQPLPPIMERRYLPIRERSLHATVKHHAIHKRRVSRRWGER